jgi:hypothetical protein
LASDLGLFGEQLLTLRQDGTQGVPTNLKESEFFHEPLRLHLALLKRYGMQQG